MSICYFLATMEQAAAVVYKAVTSLAPKVIEICQILSDVDDFNDLQIRVKQIQEQVKLLKPETLSERQTKALKDLCEVLEDAKDMGNKGIEKKKEEKSWLPWLKSFVSGIEHQSRFSLLFNC